MSIDAFPELVARVIEPGAWPGNTEGRESDWG
jgi:hypothetical protein